MKWRLGLIERKEMRRVTMHSMLHPDLRSPAGGSSVKKKWICEANVRSFNYSDDASLTSKLAEEVFSYRLHVTVTVHT